MCGFYKAKQKTTVKISDFIFAVNYVAPNVLYKKWGGR
jgi:hypothetical protein